MRNAAASSICGTAGAAGTGSASRRRRREDRGQTDEGDEHDDPRQPCGAVTTAATAGPEELDLLGDRCCHAITVPCCGCPHGDPDRPRGRPQPATYIADADHVAADGLRRRYGPSRRPTVRAPNGRGSPSRDPNPAVRGGPEPNHRRREPRFRPPATCGTAPRHARSWHQGSQQMAVHREMRDDRHGWRRSVIALASRSPARGREGVLSTPTAAPTWRDEARREPRWTAPARH